MLLRGGRALRGLQLGVLVGLALLDADLEEVADEHPRLLLVLHGRGGRRLRRGGGDRGHVWRRGGRAAERGPTAARAFAEAITALRMESSFLEPEIVTTAVSLRGVIADDMDAVDVPADGDPHAVLLLALKDADRDVGALRRVEPASSKASAGPPPWRRRRRPPGRRASRRRARLAACRAPRSPARPARAGTGCGQALETAALCGSSTALRRSGIAEDTSNLRSALPGLDDLPDRLRKRLRNIPRGEVVTHLPQVGIVADMVADPVLVHVGVDLRLAGEGFGQLERLEDRGAVGLAAAEVVDLAGAGRLDEGGHEARHVERVDVVAHLLALVAEDLVLAPLEVALDEVAEEAVELDAGVVRAR